MMTTMNKEMKRGVVFPQIEFGNDPHAIRDYAQAAEALGYEQARRLIHSSYRRLGVDMRQLMVKPS